MSDDIMVEVTTGPRRDRLSRYSGKENDEPESPNVSPISGETKRLERTPRSSRNNQADVYYEGGTTDDDEQDDIDDLSPEVDWPPRSSKVKKSSRKISTDVAAALELMHEETLHHLTDHGPESSPPAGTVYHQLTSSSSSGKRSTTPPPSAPSTPPPSGGSLEVRKTMQLSPEIFLGDSSLRAAARRRRLEKKQRLNVARKLSFENGDGGSVDVSPIG
ncbi:uncharacterized protein LOC110850222 isoform X2 [Folsomia candida]|uniref:uncharacterized protein LOC110850222 isoform X2 n=1 Tax=Folsomia candida TaxID=158441 RepID=UPI001604F630|nr:uncharacterized protein LOC110850222 isoform X2 [Folsomia candida]